MALGRNRSEKLKRAGEIFNYGIQKLYMNNPENDLVKHTIYAYLLVGDATAECDFTVRNDKLFYRIGKHMFCVCEIYFCILWFEFIFPSVCY